MPTGAQVNFRFGLSGSIFAGSDALVESAVRAEQAGFDSVTVPDLPGALSPLVALAAGSLRRVPGTGLPDAPAGKPAATPAPALVPLSRVRYRAVRLPR